MARLPKTSSCRLSALLLEATGCRCSVCAVFLPCTCPPMAAQLATDPPRMTAFSHQHPTTVCELPVQYRCPYAIVSLHCITGGKTAKVTKDYKKNLVSTCITCGNSFLCHACHTAGVKAPLIKHRAQHNFLQSQCLLAGDDLLSSP